MSFFEYGQKEIEYLSKKDKKLAAAIVRIGMLRRGITPDLFSALINSIVSQQISAKAAKTVWGRLCEVLGEVTPENIIRAERKIRECGMSARKADYIKGIAAAALDGTLPLADLPDMPDDEVVAKLSALRGVGVWTAEMLLLFSLQRPDVLSWGDLAIRRGIMLLYGHKEMDKTRFERYRRRYSPYGSVASLYLWEIAGGQNG